MKRDIIHAFEHVLPHVKRSSSVCSGFRSRPMIVFSSDLLEGCLFGIRRQYNKCLEINLNGNVPQDLRLSAQQLNQILLQPPLLSTHSLRNLQLRPDHPFRNAFIPVPFAQFIHPIKSHGAVPPLPYIVRKQSIFISIPNHNFHPI